MQGIRPEVIQQFQGRRCNIISWDGTDLIEVLERRVDPRDAMKFKIEKAAQEGKTFVPFENSSDDSISEEGRIGMIRQRLSLS